MASRLWRIVRAMGLGLASGLALLALVGQAQVSAAAPPPPLDACLARGSFNLADGDCWIHQPVYGDPFGPITSVVGTVVPRGQTIQLHYPGGAEIDFINPTRPCGDIACPHNTIVWRAGRSAGGMSHVSGCGPTDIVCTQTFTPGTVGDAGERWSVFLGQHYDGIYPVAGRAFAFYAPPMIYPVRLDPVETDGDPYWVSLDKRAYAIRPGANPVVGDCVNGWSWANDTGRFEITPTAPACIELTSSGTDNGESWFTGALPNDSGAWTVIGDPGGDAATPLRQRPSRYRALTLTPASDDIRVPFVREYRPRIDVDVHLERDSMALGSTQTVEVEVEAKGGDAGSLSGLRFSVADILAVSVAPNAVVRVVGPVESIPAEGFSLAYGATRTFQVQIRAVGLGSGWVTGSVTGRDDVGDAASNADTDPITVTYVPPPPPPGGGTDPDAPKPPTMSRAIDYANPSAPQIDLVQGYVEGPPGKTYSVTLVTSATDPCSKQMNGAGVTYLGTTQVEVAANGYGGIAHRAPLTLGHFVYGITVDGAKWSAPGNCTRVSPNLPTLNVMDLVVAEGTAASGTTAASFLVGLSYPSSNTVTVQWATANGTATSPSDYAAAGPSTVTFAPGEMLKQVTVDVVRDAADEPDERFFVRLSNAVNGYIIPTWGSPEDGEGIITITDDDAATPAPVRKPDARIKLGSAAQVGNDVYNLTGAGQSRVGSAARGATITFAIDVQNDGNVADSFKLKATGATSTRYTVKYFKGATDITAAVVAGTYQTTSVAPGRVFAIIARVTVKNAAAVGSSVTRLVTATSVGQPTKKDAVKFTARRS